MKKFIVGMIFGAVLFVPITVYAQAKDDWKLRIDTGGHETDVYIKEWLPNQGTTCYVISSQPKVYGGGENTGISCVKSAK